MPSDRYLRRLDVAADACPLCGGRSSMVETRARRSGWARVNPRWSPEIRLYAMCDDCGARRLLDQDSNVP